MSVQAFINGAWVDVADVAAPSGAMIMWPGLAIQNGGIWTGPNTGWLICNGQAVSRTIYTALFAAIGTTWGAGDGSTTFNVPDMQEAAPVGCAPSGSGASARTEVAHDTYTLAQFKDDQEQGHWHQLYWASSGSNAGRYDASYGTSFVASAFQVREAINDGVNGPPRTGTVTRGKRIGVNFIIKT